MGTNPHNHMPAKRRKRRKKPDVKADLSHAVVDASSLLEYGDYPPALPVIPPQITKQHPQRPRSKHIRGSDLPLISDHKSIATSDNIRANKGKIINPSRQRPRPAPRRKGGPNLPNSYANVMRKFEIDQENRRLYKILNQVRHTSHDQLAQAKHQSFEHGMLRHVKKKMVLL